MPQFLVQAASMDAKLAIVFTDFFLLLSTHFGILPKLKFCFPPYFGINKYREYKKKKKKIFGRAKVKEYNGQYLSPEPILFSNVSKTLQLSQNV